MAEFRQSSFAGGEFARALWARHELERYGTGLRLARNFRVTEHGALENRAGLGHCEETKGSARARYVRFVYSDEQAYLLVFTNLAVRFIFDGAYVESAPGVPLEVVTPYVEADLAYLKAAQSGDVVTITRRGYAPRELRRLAHDNWELAVVSTDAEPAWHPTVPALLQSSLSADDTTHPLKPWTWKVTSIFRGPDGRVFESAPTTVEWEKSQAYPLYASGKSYSPGDVVYYLTRPYTCAVATAGRWVDFPGVTPGQWTAGAVGPNSLAFGEARERVVLYPDRPVLVDWGTTGFDGSNFDTWDNLVAYAVGDLVTDGSGFYVAIQAGTGHAPSSSAAYWASLYSFGTQPFEVVGRRVYRGRDGVFGYVGEVGPDATSFTDDGQIPDFAISPPASTDPWAVRDTSGAVTGHSYPDVCLYFGGRRYFAREGRIIGSCVDDYARFDRSPVVRADEAVDLTLGSQRYEEIRSLVALDFLVALTASSEWAVRGGGGGASDAITADAPALAQRGSERGSSWLDAMVVDDSILHVQAKGTRVRELSPDGARFKGADLSIYAKHLFAGRTVVDWCYQEDPESTFWLVLDDGTFLSLAYNRAQQLWAWCRHDTDGLVEACACIPEGNEDALYLVVARTVGGATRRYIERMATRRVDDVREGVFLDSSLSYDGRNTTAKTLTITGGSTWDVDELVTVTASGSTFAASNVGDAVLLAPDGSAVRLVVTAYTSATVVTARLDAPLPALYRGAATTDWALAVNAYAGLDHLEGREVYGLADGVPTGPFTVSGGAIDLGTPAAILHVGLPYDQEFETLDFIGPAKSTWKAITKVLVEVESTRGELMVGESFDAMSVWRFRRVDHGYGIVPLETLTAEVRPASTWGREARVAIRNVEPTPVTVLSITREVDLGGK